MLPVFDLLLRFYLHAREHAGTAILGHRHAVK